MKTPKNPRSHNIIVCTSGIFMFIPFLSFASDNNPGVHWLVIEGLRRTNVDL